MIRFVNSYALQRSALLLELDRIIEREHLAQLIILEQRWPLLLDCLQEHPEFVAEVEKGQPPAGCPDVRDLFRDDDVVAVITGRIRARQIGKHLTKEAIEAYGQMRIPYVLEPVDRSNGASV